MDKIFIWGTGDGAKALMEEWRDAKDIEAYIDNASKSEFMSKPVYKPQDMQNIAYNAIIVTVGAGKEIYDQAMELKLDVTKFIFLYNNPADNVSFNFDLASKVFGVDIIKLRYCTIRRMQIDERCLSHEVAREVGQYGFDYVRIRILELLRNEIYSEGIMGAVAEFGVFRGKFAKYINSFFCDRVCYLFDTFEGFRESEAIKEKAKGNCGNELIQRFKKTSEWKVLSIMPYPDKIVCKKGLFPESLEGLEERFSFVSLDVDFEQSTYDGLYYFYPRLNKGGYIMIHDYNSSLAGVRDAVHKYEQTLGEHLAKVPIPDLCGSLIIVKQ